MRSVIAAGAALVFILPFAWADNCQKGFTDTGGNRYCQPVKGITYNEFGGQGSYQRVTKLDPKTGQCEFAAQSYNGHFAPLDDQLSIHLRGPLKLKQMAVYQPSSAAPKVKAKRRASSPHHRRRGHEPLHKHDKEARGVQERAVGDVVTATINGQVVSWTSTAPGSSSTPASDTNGAGSGSGSGPGSGGAQNNGAKQASNSGSSSQGSASADNEDTTSAPSDWQRVAYYDSDSGSQTGLTMMGNKGTDGCSGSWGPMGNSLSYVSSDGSKCASSPQSLAQNNYLPTDTEIAFFSDKECSGDSCGYMRGDAPNYQGWAGDEKAFFFEFQMPDDGKTDKGQYNTPNMPCLWLLNANVPRMQQYGQCSCWASGCGEFDIFEVLGPDPDQKDKGKSTVHRDRYKNSGGDSDYFVRPVGTTIKLAAIMRGSSQSAHIMILDDNTQFDSNMSKDAMDGFCNLFQNTTDLSTFTLWE